MSRRSHPQDRNKIQVHPFLGLVLTCLCLVLPSCATGPKLGVNRVREFSLSFDSLPPRLEGYKIAFTSDIHYGNRFDRERMDRLVSALNFVEADCIILGGDLTLGTSNILEFAQAAAGLRAKEGVYAVLGNHDFYNGKAATLRALRKAGIIVLDDTALTTPRGLTLGGINDFRDEFPSMAHFRDLLDPEGFTVLASHNPDFAEKLTTEDRLLFDLLLSGHTHGGQITLFGYAPIIPSEYGQKYRSGLVEVYGLPVVVSNGAGYGGNLLRFRIFAPSDFLLITLVSSDRK